MTTSTTVNEKEIKKPKNKILSILEFFRKTEERNIFNYYLILLTSLVLGFLANVLIQKGYNHFFPDDNEAKINDIKKSTLDINKHVQEIISKIESNTPLDSKSIIEKLNLISEQNEKVLPIAQGILNPTSGYLRGARLSQGPYTGQGAFFMNINNGIRGSAIQFCNGATLAYNEKQKIFVLNYQDRTERRLLDNAGALTLRGISATIHTDFDSNGALQVIYNCDTRSPT